LEAHDYFIMAIVFGFVCIGFLLSYLENNEQIYVYYPISSLSTTLFFTSLLLVVGLIVGGIVKTVVKRKRE
jgi:hypothetical protein